MELAGPTRSWTKDENGKFIGYRLHTWRTTEVWAKSLCAASKVSNDHNGMARVDVTPPKFVWRCVHLALYLIVAILVTNLTTSSLRWQSAHSLQSGSRNL